MTAPALGFFTRLLEDAPAADRYRYAVAQIQQAERYGYRSAWVAQHHFHESEGGLPSPLVFLAHAAARTSRIRLGTGVITLPMEAPVRLAEDLAVLDRLADGRVEVGLASGGTPGSFPAFGHRFDNRHTVYFRHLQDLLDAWEGRGVAGTENRLYPSGGTLPERLWHATFSADGARRAGRRGLGLMLSRTQPRPEGDPHASLPELQHPIIDAYLESLPPEVSPRIMASRTLFVSEDRAEAQEYGEQGLRRGVERLRYLDPRLASARLEDLTAVTDTHLGTPEDVIASLATDTVLQRATDVVFQVHSVDPPHEATLQSIALVAERVAPHFGWKVATPASAPETDRQAA
ncbi:putative FMN-dependent luciferase-like monooxygenase [Raineyella fluvialis]|uniref:Putative FMN-dependent luciferase-like monooxygenase n=1 Tax=Raineyella fluvialis TaxID=2662261 RepID=A0A5Q2F690_9ACTN|nr:putative FMN-dependent luciferase-like monooxygenase [Raineyella fluvialis]QGF22480.1 putative FMN-dependent luciferase-like monooxygenase [Raineyella fluvialis]